MMQKMKIWVAVIATLLLVVTAVSTSSAQDTLQKIKSSGKLDVAVYASVKPLSFVDPQTGDITGFAPDLIRLYAEKLGVKVELHNYDWSGLFPALLTGKVDVVAANVNTTIPRTVTLGLTDPWLFTGGSIAVRAGSPYHTLADLNKEGVVIAAIRGSSYIPALKRDCPKTTIKEYTAIADLVQALLTKRIEALVMDQLAVLSGIEGHNKQVYVIPDRYVPVTYSFAVSPNDYALQNSLNTFFQMIKLNGEYKALYKKWLGHDWNPKMVGY